ncbi:hypothetical protein GOP47_0004999 [Adiantum capillus-veneris]|uniref:Uncharacterized protein n=1 Tax=Adiantum capillus-veneris TaxID=13818 RepID=A0A9D4V4X2_ADICA|nr:hypothetical protein GOP47_0004999 [Adiantum capillus-veneris]
MVDGTLLPCLACSSQRLHVGLGTLMVACLGVRLPERTGFWIGCWFGDHQEEAYKEGHSMEGLVVARFPYARNVLAGPFRLCGGHPYMVDMVGCNDIPLVLVPSPLQVCQASLRHYVCYLRVVPSQLDYMILV